LRFMEGGYSADFRDVIIHTSEQSHRANAALGTTAFTIGNHVCFSRGAYDPDSWSGRLLLAHELAHVVQSRLGVMASPRASIARRIAAETEADTAALHVLHERRHVCSVPLPAGELSAWGPAGHYYTTYYVLLAAGLENAEAQRLAFYAQMPDEVDELDAESAGWAYVFSGPQITDASKDQDVKRLVDLMQKQEQYLTIQLGLHCLTGRDSWAETEARRQVLGLTSADKFAFGLALHPLGDSFAHRKLDNERLMYDAPLGHGKEWLKFKKKEHVPDRIHMRPALYRQYVKVLFHLACAKWANAKRRATWEVGEPAHGTKGVVSEAIEKIGTQTSEETQIKMIRKLSKESLGQEMDRYEPESSLNEKVPWKKFRARHGLAEHLLNRAFLLAGDWRFVSKGVRVPIATGSEWG
jgi:hypothetical protein